MAYFRGQATDYVIHYVGGRVRHEGQGATFWYMGFNSTIEVVPLNVQDGPFVFQDITRDHQTVTCQGQFSFRFADPKKAAAVLNLTVRPKDGSYVSSDLEMLSQRVGHAVRLAASSDIQARDLATNLRNFPELSRLVLDRVREDPVLSEAGVEMLSIFVLSVQPTPEVANALEAQFREGLLRVADEAIYGRRAASVDEERKIKELELATELAMAEGRRRLIEQEGENRIREAEARGKALEAESQYENEKLRKELEMWNSVDPALVAALGFRSLGMKGASQVTITTEVLSALLNVKRDASD
jgi:regulator of protease activity HflC (stomatin/prohibitin superfamily)